MAQKWLHGTIKCALEMIFDKKLKLFNLVQIGAKSVRNKPKWITKKVVLLQGTALLVADVFL